MRYASARGAITIFVALALMALLAFGAFVVDYGTMWVSRRQAQNAADAAAMAGARSLSVNGGSDAEATAAALTFAGQSPIWGQFPAAADVTVTLPFACPPSAAITGDGCIRVDVMRGTVDRGGASHTNTLPMFFGPIIGVTSQGVRATATAQAAPGNGAPCTRPWVVADRWLKNPPPYMPDSTFNPPPGGSDSYTPPSSPGTTGFLVTDSYGVQLVLKPGVVGVWSAGFTQEIDSGALTSPDQILSCPSSVAVPTVGLYDPSAGPCATIGDATDPARGCIKVQIPPSPPVWSAGVADPVGLDPGAAWNSGTNGVTGSSSTMSPRIVPLLVFNTSAYYNENQPPACGVGPGSGCVAQVVNIVGFFVEGMCNTGMALDPGVTCPDPGNDVVGRLMSYPAQILTGAGSVIPTASFLTVTRLVR